MARLAGLVGLDRSREGVLVEKAFLAGMVSGLSQAFQPQAVATGGGAAVANTALGDIGRAGLGAGASTAGQKVADYMIRRAEQYQPVIQLQAGSRGCSAAKRRRRRRPPVPGPPGSCRPKPPPRYRQSRLRLNRAPPPSRPNRVRQKHTR